MIRPALRAAFASSRRLASAFGRFRLVRWAVGGRWSLDIDGSTWFPRDRCPGPLFSLLMGGEACPSGVCFDNRACRVEFDGGDAPAEWASARACHCEGAPKDPPP